MDDFTWSDSGSAQQLAKRANRGRNARSSLSPGSFCTRNGGYLGS